MTTPLADRQRAILSALAPTRTYVVWYGVCALVGLLLCFIPLFNLVGYESSAVFGVLMGPLTAFLTLHVFERGLLAEPHRSARRRHPFKDFVLLAGRHLAMLVVPLGLLSLNALRVRNCDFGTGLLFWGLIPVGSILVGQAIGWLTAAIAPPWRWLRNLCVALIALGSAALFGVQLALQPPIVGHQLFLGYFSGSIYDEALALPGSLVAYRAANLAAVILLVCAVEVGRRIRDGHRRAAGWVGLVGAGALVVFGTIWLNAYDLGIGIERGYIAEELGGRLETEHFVIHYPETERFLKRVDRLGRDHEFRYREMADYFGTDPAADGKIHSYVYPNRQEKGRLMGARRTLVAKIWLGEMHILWPEYGHHWLAHELAHLFTAPFAASPLKLSLQNGVGVNMGLVEGIATAADWPVDELTPHQAAAALRRLEMAPDIRRIVGAGGFWTQSSGRAYTLVGSFIRFLVDEYGMERFQEAYGYGDFRGAYGKPVGELVAEWEGFVDEIALDESTMEVARYLYRRPSIFGKVCARTTAEIRRRASIAASRGDVGEMRRLYRRLIGFAPRNVDYRIEFARRLVRVGDLESGLDRVDELLERELPPVQRARLLHLRGDISWHRRAAREAGRDYARCLDEGLPHGFERLVRAKYLSVQPDRREVRRLAFEYFLGRNSQSVSLFFPMEWSRRRPGDRLAAYLVGRRLWQDGQWAGAIAYLEAIEGGLEGPTLRAETQRMLGRSLYFDEQFGRARSVFAQLADSSLSRYRSEADEWLERIAWRQSDTPVE